MVWSNQKWTLCYYVNEEPTFVTFRAKEDALNFIDEDMRDNPGVSLNNYTLFPPNTSLSGNKIITYGVPKRFL